MVLVQILSFLLELKILQSLSSILCLSDFFVAMFFFSHKLQGTQVVLCAVEHSSFISEAQLTPTQPTPKVL